MREKAGQLRTAFNDAVARGQSVNRVLRYLASEEAGCLGQDLRAWAAGGPMSVELRTEITAYQLCVLDDSMAEGPHALVSDCAGSAPTSRPEWWSATIRLSQNLQMAENIAEEERTIFDLFYRKWQLMGQSDLKAYRRLQPKRQTKKELLRFVYRTGEHSLVDWSALHVKLDEPKANRTVASSLQAIQFEYLFKTFRPGCAFTVRTAFSNSSVSQTASPGDPVVPVSVASQLQAFVVVSNNPNKKKKVSTSVSEHVARNQLPVQIQQLTFWNPASAEAAQFDVFTESPPRLVDLAGLATWKNVIKTAKYWSVSDSDIAGCRHFNSGQLIAQQSWHLFCRCIC